MIVESQWRVNGIWVPSTDANVPAFADETGKPISSQGFDKGDVSLVCHKNTDNGGWTYGASFSNLEAGRSGGRRHARILDRVRQRSWVPKYETTDSSCSSATRSFELSGFETHSTCSTVEKLDDALSRVDLRGSSPTTARSVRVRSKSPVRVRSKSPAAGSSRQVKFAAQGVALDEERSPMSTRSCNTQKCDFADGLTPILSARSLARHKEAMDRNQAAWEPFPPPVVIVPEVYGPFPETTELLQGPERILLELEQGQSLTRHRLQRPQEA